MYLHFNNKGQFKGYSQKIPTWMFWPAWIYPIALPFLLFIGGHILPFLIPYAWNHVIIPWEPWENKGPNIEYRAWLITMVLVCSVPLWILTITGYWF